MNGNLERMATGRDASGHSPAWPDLAGYVSRGRTGQPEAGYGQAGFSPRQSPMDGLPSVFSRFHSP